MPLRLCEEEQGSIVQSVLIIRDVHGLERIIRLSISQTNSTNDEGVQVLPKTI
jgi:hypothetical protein